MINFPIVAVKLDSVEAVCIEPYCMKIFTIEQCLRGCIQLCHRYITCDVCGIKQLKKNIKRHLVTHEEEGPIESSKCNYKGYDRTFSTIRFKLRHKFVLTLEKKKFKSLRFSGFRTHVYLYMYTHLQKLNLN